jgi:hypothetical protein
VTRKLAVYAADQCGTFATIEVTRMCGVGGAISEAIRLQRKYPDACVWVQDDFNADIGFDGLSDDERDAVEVILSKVRRAA